jgi:hypothetical protein
MMLLKKKYDSFKRTLKIQREFDSRPRSTTTSDVVISLTSFPARYDKLHQVITGLRLQTVLPARVVLYIAHHQVAELPQKLLKMQDDVFEIRHSEDMRSFTKLLPALKDFPESKIVTVDDDVIYPAVMLEQLLTGHAEAPGSICCVRAHRPTFTATGDFQPYNDWEFNVQDDAARIPNKHIMPTGVGGVIYPPHSLAPEVLDIEKARRLCPKGDDLWFYWMGRLAGVTYKKVGPEFTTFHTFGSQDQSLWNENSQGGNDVQIRALVEEYGMPADLGRD